MANKKKKSNTKVSNKSALTLCAAFVFLCVTGTALGSNLFGGIASNENILERIIQFFGYDYFDTELDNDISGESAEKNNVFVGNKLTTSGELDVFFFDVGQGDSSLICSNGEYMLIDAGNNDDGKLIVSQLEKMGITKINYLVGTHPHEDHIGGLDDVIKSFDVGKIFMPDKVYDSATYRSVISESQKKNIKIEEPSVGSKFYVGEALCEIMGVNGRSEDANQSSIIIQVSHGNTDFLFMGDAEIPNEEIRLWNDIDVLKVGHHGSSTSSSDDFLEQAEPEVAVVSCGKDNPYGHPHREIVEVFNELGVNMYRTDKDGTIKVVSNGETYSIEKMKLKLDGNT